MSKKIGDVRVDVHFQSDGKELRDDVRKDPSFKEAGKSAAKQVDEGYDDQWTKDLEQRIKKENLFEKRRAANLKGQTTKTTKEIGRLWDKFYADQHDNSNAIRNSLAEINKVWDEMKGHISGTETETESWFDSFRIGFSRVRRLRHDDDDDAERWAHRMSTRFEGIGTRVGTLFGKGSRNNFLNFFGSLVGSLTALPGLAFKAFGAVGDAWDSLRGETTKGINFAESLGASLAELAPIAAEAAAGIAAALIALPFIFGLVASAIMLVTGAVIALAGALTFALAGGIVAAAGALVPLAAAIGVTILAFKNMTKEQKKAFTGVKNAFSDLGKVAANHLFANAAEDAKLFEGALDGVHGVVAGIADSIREVAEGWLQALNSPGFHKFMNQMGVVLPRLIAQIGPIIQNMATFLGEAFLAAQPLIEDFLGWLTGITTTMADLGKGGGKSKLAQFFSDIQPTMHQVGDAIGQVIGLVFDLFNGPGQKTGGSMFESLAENVRKFRNFLAKAKKDGSLQKFFDDARKLADKIGEATIQVGKLVAALDTPENRKILIFMVDAFTKIARGATVAAHMFGAQVHMWAVVGGAIRKAFSKIPELVHGAMKAIRETFAPVGPFLHRVFNNISFEGLKRGARNAWKAIRETFAPVGPWFRARWASISSSASTAWHAVSQAASSAWKAIRSAANTAISAIAGFFRGLPGRITNINWSAVGHTIGSLIRTAITSAMTGLPSDIANLFSGLASRIINQIGQINIVPHINWPSPPGWLSKITGHAAGGLIAAPQLSWLGERGPELVVPLTGPLSQVDPAVREMSAIARGMASSTTSATARGGKSVTTGPITIITPTKDPRAVASQVVNRIAAASYI